MFTFFLVISGVFGTKPSSCAWKPTYFFEKQVLLKKSEFFGVVYVWCARATFLLSETSHHNKCKKWFEVVVEIEQIHIVDYCRADLQPRFEL